MHAECKFVPKTESANHRCCFFSRFDHNVHPVIDTRQFQFEESESQQRRQVEAFIFSKLEEYSREKSTTFFHLTSFSHIRRRLKRDLKSFLKRIHPYLVPEEKLIQWLDETLQRITSHLPHLHSLFNSSNDLQKLFAQENSFSSATINTQWQQLQLKRAKEILPNTSEDLLDEYRKHVVEKLTPKKLENNRLSLKSKDPIDLDVKFNEAELVGREYLTKIFDDYQKRQYPNVNLLREMIQLGMNQMVKRPKTDEFRNALSSSNVLVKAMFIIKSKNAYTMSLKNIADDFMFLRFGRSLDYDMNEKDSITSRFASLIHMFLNTISTLLHSVQSETSLTTFSQFDSNLSSEEILSPLVYIDQWTWLIQKWKIALQTFPVHLTKSGAFGRLIRTTIGVGIARLYGFAENNDHEDLDSKFFQALQMGFYYGVAYALVDGLQDSDNNEEQQHSIDVDHWLSEMERILCGHELDPSSLPQLPMTSLLLETFHSLVQLTSVNSIAEETFVDLALLLRSQRADKKDSKRIYQNNIELYLGSLMKSHFTYTATAFMGGARMVEGHERLWTMPFLGQLTDDCRDFNEDRRDNSVTPVTYYAQHKESNVLNPFFVFLFVCEDLYLQSQRDANTGAFLGRRIIRTLRSLQKDFNEFLLIFVSPTYPELFKYTLSLEKLFDRVSDPEKSVFRRMNQFGIDYSFNHRKVETFAFDHLPLIEKQLTRMPNNNDPIVLGMNHSLKAGGKRLRPLLLLMVTQLYHIDIKRVLPLAIAIEYLHTSSLIFDDLPAQDNAPLRRGQPTLHMPIESDQNNIPSSLTEGRAQLVAVDLIAQAIRLVTVDLHREGFPYESINQVTAELSQSMDELCHGQFLDLQAARVKRTTLTIDELDHIAQLKTGKAIEVVLVCPVILAQIDQNSLKRTIDRLRELGRLMGILFQMKDDLLDVEGNVGELGKLTNIDQHNETMTYVSLLGIENTRQRLKSKRKEAEKILNELWPQAGTIRDVIRHICERKN
ncbi:unnamed protein product [Adineta ricciae]|uniref:Uncharacterized protein n=1 Tax=Adineta ricciae TaxID=249248 RepID=A0A814X5M2_ADIRI|nr:unnamed protein product [Adineta ricciae]CAF1316607.1 unnamed protein product [Adineta ricciae]